MRRTCWLGSGAGVRLTATEADTARAVANRRTPLLVSHMFAGPPVRAVGVDCLTHLAQQSAAEAESGFAVTRMVGCCQLYQHRTFVAAVSP